MNKPLLFLASTCCLTSCVLGAEAPKKPNVVIINADDLGWGDLSCYGNKVFKTPHVDALAQDGVRFTSAYASAATCTPSRYSLLTGEYAWRKKGTGVLPGDAKMIIPPHSQTVASVMKKADYQTAAIGKWHLGLESGNAPIDFNKKIKNGPNTLGFDHYFIMAATNDRVPSVFIENQHVVGLDPKDPIEVSYHKKVGNDPTGRENPELLTMKHSHGHDGTIVNGVGRIGWMKGGHTARWNDENMSRTYLQQAEKFLNQTDSRPFFLYFASQDPHVPRIAHKDFQGKSGLGPRGDVIMQFDWSVGELVKMLKDRGLYENTMIVLTSDNGPYLDDGYIDDAVALSKEKNHNPAGIFTGTKYTSYEGGGRIPFIVCYPAQVEGGKISDAKVSQVDCVATLAALVGEKVDSKIACDAQNQLPAWLNKDPKGRSHIVFEGSNGLAYIDDQFKFFDRGYAPENKCSQQARLINLNNDIEERTNLLKQNPKIAESYREKLNQVKALKPIR